MDLYKLLRESAFRLLRGVVSFMRKPCSLFLAVGLAIGMTAAAPTATADHENNPEDCYVGSTITIKVWNEDSSEVGVGGAAECPDWTQAACDKRDESKCKETSETEAQQSGSMTCQKYDGDHARCTSAADSNEGGGTCTTDCIEDLVGNTSATTRSQLKDAAQHLTATSSVHSWIEMPPQGMAFKCVEGHCWELAQICGPVYCEF